MCSSSVASIAKQINAQLILLHVIGRPLNSEDDSYENYYNSMRLMAKFSNEFGLKKHTQNIYNNLTVEDRIINFTKLISADLIAITPNGFWRLAHVFNKNTTDKLTKKSAKAILSIKTHPSAPISSEIFYAKDNTQKEIKIPQKHRSNLKKGVIYIKYFSFYVTIEIKKKLRGRIYTTKFVYNQNDLKTK